MKIMEGEVTGMHEREGKPPKKEDLIDLNPEQAKKIVGIIASTPDITKDSFEETKDKVTENYTKALVAHTRVLIGKLRAKLAEDVSKKGYSIFANTNKIEGNIDFYRVTDPDSITFAVDERDGQVSIGSSTDPGSNLPPSFTIIQRDLSAINHITKYGGILPVNPSLPKFFNGLSRQK